MAINLGQLLQGPNSGSYTPETIDRRRQMAQAMMKGSSGIQDIRHPLQGLAQMLQAGIGGYQANRADEDEATQRSAANERIAQLLGSGMDANMGDLTSAAGDPWANDAQQQLAMMLLGEQVKKQNAPPPEIPDAVEALDLRAQRAGLQPGTPEYADFMIQGGGGSGQTINVGGNNDIGTIPQGMMVTRDEAGNVTGMVPIPGGPAEAEAAAAAEKAAVGDAIADTTGNIVTQDIDRALGLIDTPGLLPTTGFAADWFNRMGGTAGNDLRNLLNTVKANTAFDALQQMRMASPTGGALGAVTAPELTLLEAAKGALEQSQSPQQLKDNLVRLQNIYLDIVHGPGQGPARKAPSFEQSDEGATPAVPEAGAVMDGYRFKGGDPADPNSWEKV